MSPRLPLALALPLLLAGCGGSETPPAAAAAAFTAGPSKLDTDRLERGDRVAPTFSKAGRFASVCAFHAFMKGEVVVDE